MRLISLEANCRVTLLYKSTIDMYILRHKPQFIACKTTVVIYELK